jgi:16S rRNA (adenine1518-N6/adenine1519-N6)-dimethyltransferase
MSSPQASTSRSQHSRGRLRSLGLRPKKRLSQSFLEDQRVAVAIVRAARVGPRTEVLEVGPGLGVLTSRLARLAKRVVAVEIDAQLAETLEGANVSVVNADILATDPTQFFTAAYTVVANLPYHITSPALRHLLAAGPPFAERLVVMVQAEVADRIAARPGDLSALAVLIQVQAAVQLLRRVPAAAFYPPPKVDSAVLVLEPLGDTQRAVQREALVAFSRLVHAGFKQPRKTIANSLADGLEINKTQALDLLQRAGIEPGRRPGAVDVADWVRLFRSL